MEETAALFIILIYPIVGSLSNILVYQDFRKPKFDKNAQCCFHTTHVFHISSKLRCSLKRDSVTSSITIFRSISLKIAILLSG